MLMLLVEETHSVIGRKTGEFEELVRDTWMPALARSDDCRLLFCFRQFTVYDAFGYVTIVGVRDGAAYEELVHRLQGGDLADGAEQLDACRHDVQSRILVELPFAPLGVDLGDVASSPGDVAASVYMEDSIYPYPGKLRALEHAIDTIYTRELAHRAPGLGIQACFRTAPGGGHHPEVIILAKWLDPSLLSYLIAGEQGPEPEPGGWMHEALKVRDQWKSRLLSTLPWSPLH
jgi:hypothetical protein